MATQRSSSPSSNGLTASLRSSGHTPVADDAAGSKPHKRSIDAVSDGTRSASSLLESTAVRALGARVPTAPSVGVAGGCSPNSRVAQPFAVRASQRSQSGRPATSTARMRSIAIGDCGSRSGEPVTGRFLATPGFRVACCRAVNFTFWRSSEQRDQLALTTPTETPRYLVEEGAAQFSDPTSVLLRESIE